MKSSDYKVSLKGAWTQENNGEFVFEIHPLHGNVVDQSNVQCVIRNAKEASDEKGSLSLGGWEYRAGSKDNGILKARFADEDTLLINADTTESKANNTIQIGLT